MGFPVGLKSIARHRKSVKCLLLQVFTLATSLNMWAQTPPPNDDYANRIQLVGTDVTFSGTTAGATQENGEDVLMANGLLQNIGLPTVWWSWTARLCPGK